MNVVRDERSEVGELGRGREDGKGLVGETVCAAFGEGSATVMLMGFSGFFGEVVITAGGIICWHAVANFD